MDISYLCFSNVCTYITASERASQDVIEVQGLVSQFLRANRQLIIEPGVFNELGPELAGKSSPLKIGGISYEIVGEDWKDAIRLSKFFNISYQQCLRVVAQTHSRNNMGNNRMIIYAKRILQERNGVVETLLAILNAEDETVDVRKEFISAIAAEKTTFCLHLMQNLSKLAKNFTKLDQTDRLWSEEIQDIKNCYDIAYAGSILKLLSLLIMNTETPVGVITEWFLLLQDTNHLTCFKTKNFPSENFDQIEAFTSITTVLMLGLNASSFSINTDAPFFQDVGCFKLINDILLDHSQNGLIVYYWSFVTSLKAYLFEEFPEQNSSFVEKVYGETPINQMISIYVQRAEQIGVLESFVKYSHCLNFDELWITVLASLLGVALHFVTMTKATAKTVRDILTRVPQSFVEKFLTNDEVEKKLSLIRNKIPLVKEGLLPLIYLTTAHPEFANFEWKNMNTYTVKLPLSSFSYDLADSDGPFTESSDLIVLKQELLVCPPFEYRPNVLMPIPEGTRGKVIPTSSSTEDAVIFMHSYNGWSMLGRIIQNICETYTQFEEDQVKIEKTEVAIAIIDLIASAVGVDVPLERSTEILQHLSGYVENGDIVSTLFKLFELALHSKDFKVINAGLGLMIELTPNFPHFVWSHLARSSLIDRNGKESLAVSVLDSMGRASADFESTLLLIKLTNCLISESLSIEETFPERMKKEIFGKLMTHMVRIYEGFQFQSYSYQRQRLEIGQLLTSLFTKVLYAVYGVDPSSPPERKVTKVLAESAQVIIDAFLNSSRLDSRTVNSLITILISINTDGALARNSLPFASLYSQLIEQSFDLANLLISVRSLLKNPPSALERCIYSSSANLVNIYACYWDQCVHVTRLLTHLVRAPWKMEPPSLLSYLGQDNSRLLLNCVAYDLKGPLINSNLAKSLYSFFSSIMEGKQDGLAILFLTGKLVCTTEKAKNAEGEVLPSNSLLRILKDNSLKLDKLSEAVSSQLLDAIAYAFNTWTAATGYENDSKLITILVKRLESFGTLSLNDDKETDKSKENVVQLSNQYRVLSRVAEILALALFTSTADNELLMTVLNKPNLAVMVKKIFHIDGYDKQLQRSLQVKFKAYWPELDLSMFTSSLLLRSSRSFQSSFFDIPLMDQFFGSDERWVGSHNTPGFRNEVMSASSSLHFITYQISACKSWGALLTSFIRRTPTPLNDTYLEIAHELLEPDSLIGIDASIFRDVYLTKIELAFYILYSCLQTNRKIPDDKLKGLLFCAAGMMKSKEVNYLNSVAQPFKYSYYRPLIRIVIIICSLVKDGKLFAESVSNCLLEFFELTFGHGVNLIMSNILSEINQSVSHGKKPVIPNLADKIQDLLLLLSLFTKVKNLHPPSDFELILASSINEVGTIKAILNVYSSSHLLNIEEEPVLCDLSLTFLTELCSVGSVAERLLGNDLFSVILESPISVAIQQGKVTADIQPKLHALWSDGLLTIMLQLLSRFGKKVLPECCLFLSYFYTQVSYSISQWSDSSLSVSKAAVKETSQLITMQGILNTLDYQNYLTDSNIRTKAVSGEVVYELFPGLDTDTERKELSYSFKHLLTHPKYLNSRIVATTLEEQRILEDDDARANYVKAITISLKNLNQSLSSPLHETIL
ncbi:LADA_0H05732g1_1 [Lachancea dasiensis]|uniref:Nucleoporin NUP188 n=1 Tax=Lachancea dasiensis TaxID=1072105 RepID=A0A1G4K1A7_9SACH|nr:LADA_0H05732g1_1 [Lachancea dasiensis]